MLTYTSVDHQQQPGGGVTHHLPESEEALNIHIINLAAQLVTQPQHQNGHYQQPQPNVPVETVQCGGRSKQFCNHHSKRMCTSVVDKQQVKRHHPESEALNNADTVKYII